MTDQDREKQFTFLYAVATMLLERLGGEQEFSKLEWDAHTRFYINTEKTPDDTAMRVFLTRRPE